MLYSECILSIHNINIGIKVGGKEREAMPTCEASMRQGRFTLIIIVSSYVSPNFFLKG